MNVNKKVLSVLLVVLCLLSCCSFFSFAEDAQLTVSDMSAYLMRDVTTGNETSSSYFTYIDGTGLYGSDNVLCHWFKAEDPSFYATGGQKILVVTDGLSLVAGHNYEMTFYAGLNFNAVFDVRITYSGNELLNSSYSAGLQKITFSFTAPETTSSLSSIRIYVTLGQQFGYGSAGQNARFLISETIEMTDKTDNPGWLGKILKKIDDVKGWFSNLGNTIGGFFSSLSESIGQWFTEQKQKIQDFSNNVGQWFTDLGNNIKQWFIDLGEDIGEFFTMLKNYILYFQHPVTTNSDGVLIGKDGKPVYTNPFESAIEKVKTTVDDWLSKINDFVDGMETSRQNVTSYLENGSGVINTVLAASPILSVCVLFAVGFLVIRKVVGR